MAAFQRRQYAEASERLAAAMDGESIQSHLARFYAARALFHMGVQALNHGDYDRAATLFHRSAEVGPGAAPLPRYLVACYVGQGRFEKAADQLETMRKTDPDPVGVYVRLALAHWRNGRGDRAIAALHEGIDREPGAWALPYHLGTILAALERFDEAVAAFEKAIALFPECVEAHLRLGWCHAASGRHDAALGAIRRAHGLRPRDPQLAMELSLASKAAARGSTSTPLPRLEIPTADVSEDDAAVAELAEIITRDSDFVEAFLSLPGGEVDHEAFELLAATLERAIQMHPRYPDLHHHCSRVYERLGHHDAARAACERAVEINPRYISAMVHMGTLFASTDRRGEAIDRLEAARAAGAEDARLHCALGNLYRAEGYMERARSAYEEALRLDAEMGEARQGLEALAA